MDIGCLCTYETTRRVALELYAVDRDEIYFNGPYEAMWAVMSVTRKRCLCNGRETLCRTLHVTVKSRTIGPNNKLKYLLMNTIILFFLPIRQLNLFIFLFNRFVKMLIVASSN